MLVIVDYGLGNVGSIRNMFTRCGADAVVSGEADVVRQADKLVLPGVGSFDTGMQALEASGLLPALEQRALEDRVPLLGICLGMQMLGRHSAEGSRPGLGWLDIDSVRFSFDGSHTEKVPHMGWTPVTPVNGSALFAGLDPLPSFYFLHSYHVRSDRSETVSATSDYGYEFPCVVQQDNLIGVQFHPEKSHSTGVALFRNFAERF